MTILQNVEQYGFLGPIVGIVGVAIGAVTAILFGWTGTMDKWKPPSDVLPGPLNSMVTMVCALAILIAWLFAEPANQDTYLDWTIRLAAIGLVGFILYVGLRQYCGRYSRPRVDGNNAPANERDQIWGGFWRTPRAQRAVKRGETIETFLAGNGYSPEAVWPPSSLTLSAMITSVVLLAAVVGGTTALSTAATAAQVALTKRPAREIFSSKEVPGLPQSSQQLDSVAR